MPAKTKIKPWSVRTREKNNLSAGSTFTAYGKTVTVSGIFDAGNTFANSGLVMPLSALQRLSGRSGSVTSAAVKVNSIDNMAATTSAVKDALGDKADVVSNEDTAKQAVEPLESVKSISTFSLIGRSRRCNHITDHGHGGARTSP